MKSRLPMLALLGALACPSDPAKTPDNPPAPAPRQPPEPLAVAEPILDPKPIAAAELLDIFDALAKLHQQHIADCPALAAAIKAFHAVHVADLAAVPDEVLAQIDADEPLRLRLRAAMESIMSASMACRADPAFVAAQSELFGP